VPVHIRLTDPKAAGSLDQALVEVAITDQTVHDALGVPVSALLARAGGGYSVEVVARDGTHHLVRVRLGLFDDAAGMVQASGPGLAAGEHVVVPGE
jgi:multidrug efflux pump subunit AcrA (membrane-fusion protein)